MLDDKERKKEKKIAAISRNAAMSVGIGVGFFVLVPLLPEIGNEVKADAMKGLFASVAMAMIGYGAILLLAVMFARSKSTLIAGLMSWFVAPSIAVWFLMEAMDILNKQ